MIRNILQFAIVTPDLGATVKSLQEHLRLGPMKVWDFKPPGLFDTTIGGKNEQWSMKLAFGWIGEMQFEVIEPTGGDSLYQVFLNNRGSAGVQHLLLDRGKTSYETMKRELSAQGYPLHNEAKTNVAVQLGPLRIPPLPMWLAKSSATTFGYTDTLESMKVALEISKYPPGIKPRQGIRMGVPSYWIGDDKAHFETLPETSLITAVTGFVVLTNDLEQTKLHYDAVFQGNQQTEDAGSVTYQLDTIELKLLRPPVGSAWASILRSKGEGVQVLQVKLRNPDPTHLSTNGFEILENNSGHLLIGHKELPFYMEAGNE